MSNAQRFIAAIGAVALVMAGALGAFLMSDDGAGSPRSVQAQGSEDSQGIGVNGEGEVTVQPDVAQVMLGVEVEGSDIGELREDADGRMQDVIDALVEAGIEEDDIQTAAYNITERDRDDQPPRPEEQQEMEEEQEMEESEEDSSSEEAETDEAETEEAESEEAESGEAEDDAVSGESEEAASEPTESTAEGEADNDVDDVDVVGYQLTQLIQVTIRDIDTTGDMIDVALDAGANRVGSIYFEVEDRAEAVAQARELAVENAREKAEDLADLTGVGLGAPLNIREHSSSASPVRMDEVAQEEMAADADGGTAAPIQPGQSTVRVDVEIIYDIE